MKIRDFVVISLLCAITVVLGIVPALNMSFTGVPISLQHLGVLISSGLGGAKRGFLSQLLFIGLISVGIPVLPGGRGGIDIMMGPSGGFLVMWPIAALIIGYLLSLIKPNIISSFVIMFFFNSILVILVGALRLSYVLDISYVKSLQSCAIYIPGAIIKSSIGAFIYVTIKKRMPFLIK